MLFCIYCRQPESKPVAEEKKKSRPKDVFGRPLPTEEEFEILKNAPRYVSVLLRSIYYACLLILLNYLVLFV